VVSERDRRALWLRGVLDLCILATLRERERYGYELAQVLEQAGLGKITGGTLYPALKRLADAGLVATEWRSGDGGPGRKYYALTPAGLVFLDDQSERWHAFDASVRTLLD
jgi:PadR family transcriptional regulator PadR